MKNTILFSAIETPDGTLLKSNSRHDFNSHTDKLTGKFYAVDGGNDYQKITGDIKDLTSYIIRSNDPISVIRSITGRGGTTDGPFRACLLKNMSDEWLDNSIDYVKKVDDENSDMYVDIYQREVEYRKNNSISIPDSIDLKDSWDDLVTSESLKEIFPM